MNNYKIANENVAFFTSDTLLPKYEIAQRFFVMWRDSPKHHVNIIATNIDRGATSISYYNDGDGTFYYYGTAINLGE